MPETWQKELRSELLNGNCYPGVVFPSKNTNFLPVVDDSSLAAINTAMTAGLLSPA